MLDDLVQPKAPKIPCFQGCGGGLGLAAVLFPGRGGIIQTVFAQTAGRKFAFVAVLAASSLF